MKPGKVRPIALCLFSHENRILVAEGYDTIKAQPFYRPLGGKIEFGEYGDMTVIRELQEEIGEAVTDLRYLGTFQNIFTYNGKLGHEIVLVYDGKFVDATVYQRPTITGTDDERVLFTAFWKPLEFFNSESAPLYPAGLLELLTHEV